MAHKHVGPQIGHGTYDPERIPSAERDVWRTDFHLPDGPDPSFDHEPTEGHELVPPSKGPA